MSLELRYGREDEELMGLQFCNEMVLVNHTIFNSEDKPSLEVPDPGEKFGCLLKQFKIGEICFRKNPECKLKYVFFVQFKSMKNNNKKSKNYFIRHWNCPSPYNSASSNKILLWKSYWNYLYGFRFHHI